MKIVHSLNIILIILLTKVISRITTSRQQWLQQYGVSSVIALSFGTSCTPKVLAIKDDPLVQILVEKDDLGDYRFPEKAMFYVKAFKEENGLPVLGAKISTAEVTFPAMFQLYPINIVENATLRSFNEESLLISVQVLSDGEVILEGSGVAKYLRNFGDIISTPVRLPAYISLRKITR